MVRDHLMSHALVDACLLCGRLCPGRGGLPEPDGRLGEEKEGQETRDAVHNIRQAVAFLRQWGWTAFADNIESWLKRGANCRTLDQTLTSDKYRLWSGFPNTPTQSRMT
ncbi:MAG: hypothetical protein HY711_05700 [Candidatus Melainabacteria bacterium]|nr:hypothetical protein [Candidatus Melainabacteria bacterium]